RRPGGEKGRRSASLLSRRPGGDRSRGGAAVTASALVAVPALFWMDHADRSPLDEGQALAVPAGRRGSQVLLRADDPGLAILKADAAFYADADSMDDCPRSIRESARRTLRALDSSK